MKMRMYLIILCILLAVSVGVWKFLQSASKSAQTERNDSHDQVDEHGHQEENIIFMTSDQISDLDIQTEIAGPGELSVSISTRGKIILHPNQVVHVLPKMSGVAKEVLKNIGDTVATGDVLAILESREMADIKANYLASVEKLFLASSLLEREQRLYKKKVSAEQDYLNAMSVHQEARINVQLAEQRLHAFGISEEEMQDLTSENEPDLRLYEIRSPINGVITARHITKGEYIENTTTIFQIANLSIIWIDIGVYPKDLLRVRKGQLVNILFPDGKTAAAKIIYLSPIIQDETITAQAIAELTDPDENWRPGSFVKVDIATEKQSVPILVSKKAIQEIDGKEYIFVKVPEGFEKRQVQLGVSNGSSVEIVSGLNQKEAYAVSNTFLLKADLNKKEAEHEH
jgi:cobalt-zinc-cadmium efflux system membrane fusion protein